MQWRDWEANSSFPGACRAAAKVVDVTGRVLVGRPLAAGGVTDEYDAAVVGSGAGGLTTAVCLARQGRRVAVFEQHYTAGGYTHAYRRRGWESGTSESTTWDS